jgi:cytochrome c
MSDLKLNSIVGAVLGSVLGVMVIGIGAEAVIEPHYPEKAGFLPEVAEAPVAGAPEAPSGPPDFGRLFADAGQLQELIARGERVSAQCASCHSFEAGGANRIGPNLHNAFGSNAGAVAGFEYSEAMRAHGPWDYLSLDAFLASPARAVPGTKMAFAGIRNETDRVALIAYLRSISTNSVPLPAPLPETAPVEDAAASSTAPG